jgi:hypothetical protein
MDAETKILTWMGITPNEHTCRQYKEYFLAMQATYPNVPQLFWDYLDFPEYLLDLWRSNRIRIVYYDEDEEVECIHLEDIGEHFPVWFAKETTYFIGHPFKHSFYIVERKTDLNCPTS